MAARQAGLEQRVGSERKTVKFHGTEVANVKVISLEHGSGSRQRIRTFDAAKDELDCEAINVQVVSDFVTITFYKNEEANASIQRHLIPNHKIERIVVEDLQSLG
jgi:hypothetical protein